MYAVVEIFEMFCTWMAVASFAERFTTNGTCRTEARPVTVSALGKGTEGGCPGLATLTLYMPAGNPAGMTTDKLVEDPNVVRSTVPSRETVALGMKLSPVTVIGVGVTALTVDGATPVTVGIADGVGVWPNAAA